jgi:alpha-ketoglutarate-dependent taurine dioxygenase
MNTLTPTTHLLADSTPGGPPTLHVAPAGDPVAWVAEHREELRSLAAGHGNLLVRGLGLRDAAHAGQVFRALGDLMTEREAFAERQRHAPGVYSASRWPANQGMCVHHELSYRLEFPGMMLFACLTPAARGGATSLADASAALDALPSELVRRFERLGWLLVRNYGDGIGASLEEAFGVTDRAAIEAYCGANAIRYEWRPDGGLRTRQRRSAVIRHPVTGQRLWFNQIAFLSEWAMHAEVREYLIDEYGADGLPFTTRYGDGSPIDEETVTLLNATYDAQTVRARWEAGDLLMVDNLRTAHGRDPFDGDREVVVGLADPVRLADCAPSVPLEEG